MKQDVACPLNFQTKNDCLWLICILWTLQYARYTVLQSCTMRTCACKNVEDYPSADLSVEDFIHKEFSAWNGFVYIFSLWFDITIDVLDLVFLRVSLITKINFIIGRKFRLHILFCNGLWTKNVLCIFSPEAQIFKFHNNLWPCLWNWKLSYSLD